MGIRTHYNRVDTSHGHWSYKNPSWLLNDPDLAESDEIEVARVRWIDDGTVCGRTEPVSSYITTVGELRRKAEKYRGPTPTRPYHY